jgi:hypothetical protein
MKKSLERRLAALEEQHAEAEEQLPWESRFVNWMCDTFGRDDPAVVREFDWLIPAAFQDRISCGLQWQGWRCRLSPESVFCKDSDFAGLWDLWTRDRYAVSVNRHDMWDGSEWNFWTPRPDQAQESLRSELVRRMRAALLAEGDELAGCLPGGEVGWQPTDPTNVATSYGHKLNEPQSLYYRWREEAEDV